jgi:hypothetical protein
MRKHRNDDDISWDMCPHFLWFLKKSFCTIINTIQPVVLCVNTNDWLGGVKPPAMNTK